MEKLFKQITEKNPAIEGEYITNLGNLYFNGENWKDGGGFKYNDIQWFMVEIVSVKNKNNVKN